MILSVRIVLPIAFLCAGGLFANPCAAQMSANYKDGGGIVVGASTTNCDSTTEGGLRWSSSNTTFEMCDGSSWKKIIATGGTGDPSNPPSGTGYFVVSSGAWTGAGINRISGANSLCLSDLQSNDWLNKADAVSRGLVNSTHIQAFICGSRSGICQLPIANTTYTFAASGSIATGGATFTTDSSSQGPGNTQNWSGSNYFGSNYTYWTGMNTTSSTLWGVTPHSLTCQDSGSDWVSASPGGVVGNSNSTNAGRWSISASSCTNPGNLICMVHPGNESSMQPAYFVVTNSTWDGNLGGLAGADAKCLTELSITNTNWKGYATANANGQLVSTKVKAFLCTGASCNNLMANQTYSFAAVGNVSAGGASFTTNSSGQGPGDSSNWSGTNYFSGTHDYWSNRSGTATLWATTRENNISTCSDFTSTGSNAPTGSAANTGVGRYSNAYLNCNVPLKLVCFVNP